MSLIILEKDNFIFNFTRQRNTTYYFPTLIQQNQLTTQKIKKDNNQKASTFLH